MISSTEMTAFERGVDPVVKLVLPPHAEQLVSFQPDPQLLERIEELAEKSTEGELTPAEREEYAGYVRANNFVAILQRQARRLLAH
jgi:hypothetical protein